MPLKRKPKKSISVASRAGKVTLSTALLGSEKPTKLAITKGTSKIKAKVRRSRAN